VVIPSQSKSGSYVLGKREQFFIDLLFFPVYIYIFLIDSVKRLQGMIFLIFIRKEEGIRDPKRKQTKIGKKG
jgi:hypothetical protein